MSHTQQNNFISISSGIVGGVGKYLADGGTFEIIKIIIFAFISAIFGYLGNNIAKEIHNYFK